MTDERLRVMVVDPSPEGTAGLKRLLNFDDLEFVAESVFGPVALTSARNGGPDMVVVAAAEPLARSLSTIQLLCQGTPHWTVVALTRGFDGETFRKLVLAGARDVLLRSPDGRGLHDALMTARRADLERRAPAPEHVTAPSGSIVAVFGVKGGIGKTTIATNLAVSLARESARSVALVDLDVPYGDVALMLDLQPSRYVAGAIDPAVLPDPDRLQAFMTPGPAGVQVLAASGPRDDPVFVTGEQAGELLRRLAALYDFVVVDLPTAIDELSAGALDVADLVLVVTTPEAPALHRTEACLTRLGEFPADKVRVVLNRANSRTRIDQTEVSSVLRHPVAWAVANDHAAMQAAAFGQPVVLAQPRSALSMSIREIATQVAGIPPPPPRRGWFGWRRPPPEPGVQAVGGARGTS